jgi:hypothetical protein
MRRLQPWLAFVCLSSVAAPAQAADTCTIAYKVEGSFVVSDTPLGKGDARQRVRGSLVVEFPQGKDAEVIDGKVKILHYSMYEHFRIDSVAEVTTWIHHYAPLCNGEDNPTWRRSTDKGFPASCEYTGRGRAVAVGELRRADNTIKLAKCKAAPTYWSSEREEYKPTDKSKGRGCVERMHAAGNIHCDGRLACKLGSLRAGDNPQFATWTQPFIHGPAGSQGVLSVSADLRSIRSPRAVLSPHGSFNVPNDSPSRTWFSFTAVQNDESRFTTCR